MTSGFRNCFRFKSSNVQIAPEMAKGDKTWQSTRINLNRHQPFPSLVATRRLARLSVTALSPLMECFTRYGTLRKQTYSASAFATASFSPMLAICQRILSSSGRMTEPAQVKEARLNVGLSASAAAAIVDVTTVTWQRWEGQTSRAPEIPYAQWNLFLLLTDKHPVYQIIERSPCTTPTTTPTT